MKNCSSWSMPLQGLRVCRNVRRAGTEGCTSTWAEEGAAGSFSTSCSPEASEAREEGWGDVGEGLRR